MACVLQFRSRPTAEKQDIFGYWGFFFLIFFSVFTHLCKYDCHQIEPADQDMRSDNHQRHSHTRGCSLLYWTDIHRYLHKKLEYVG